MKVDIIYRSLAHRWGNGTPQRIPLDGDRQTAYDEVAAIGDEANPVYGVRECFDPSTTAHVGFAWYLPVDHANEIQTDSVQFDVGFYTEQCRHNDGTGIDTETLGTCDITSGPARLRVHIDPSTVVSGEIVFQGGIVVEFGPERYGERVVQPENGSLW